MRRRLAVIALAAAAHATPAFAHEIGFGDLALQPATTLETALPLLAVALLWRQNLDSLRARTVALALGSGIAAGLVLQTREGWSFLPSAPLGLALGAGILAALAAPLSGRVLVLISVALGVSIGATVHLAASAALDLFAGFAASLFGAFAVLLVIATTLNPVPYAWHQVALRVAGSWIAAIALIALALSLRNAI